MAPTKIVLLSAIVVGATAFSPNPAFSSSTALKGSLFEDYMKSRGQATQPAAPAPAPAPAPTGGLFEEYMKSRGSDSFAAGGGTAASSHPASPSFSVRPGGPKSAKPLPKPGRPHPGSTSNYLGHL